MRFKMRLIEKISANIIKKIIDNYNKYVEKLNKQPGAYDKSPDIINNVIMKAIKDSDDRFRNELKDMVPVIATSIKEKGTQNNKFLKFLSTFPDEKLLANNADKLSYLNQLYVRNYIDLNSNGTINVNGKQIPYIYLQPSLYDKSLEDFKYIANAFALLSDEYYVKKHFKDPKVVNLQSFYDRDGKVRDKQRIYNTVDDWYYKSGSENKDDESSSPASSPNKEFTMADLRRRLPKDTRTNEQLLKLFQELAKKYAITLIKNNSTQKHIESILNNDKAMLTVIDGHDDEKIFSDISSAKTVAKELFDYIMQLKLYK